MLRPKMITIVILIMLFSITLNLPYPSEADDSDYRVSIQCLSNEHYTVKNKWTDYRISVTNNGTRDDTYNLTYDSPPHFWSAYLNASTLFIPAGESRNITLNVKPTCPCEYGKSAYINVTATSQYDTNVTDSIQTITTYVQAGVYLIFQNVSTYQGIKLRPGDWQEVDIRIKNDCEYNDTFSLIVSPYSGISAESNVSTISLTGKNSTIFTVNVSTSMSTKGEDYRVSIIAISLHDDTEADSLYLNVYVVAPNPSVSKINFSNNRPKEGENVAIYTEILNNGSLGADNISVIFSYVRDNDTIIQMGTERVSLGINESVTLHKEFNASSNITGVVIEIHFEEKYENIEQSYSMEELNFSVEKLVTLPNANLSKNLSDPILILLGLLSVVVLAIIVIFVIMLKRRLL